MDINDIIEVSVILHLLQKLLFYVSDVIFIRNPFYDYVFSSLVDIDSTFISLIGAIGAIRFESGVWDSFFFVIGVLFKITLTENCLEKSNLILMQQILISLSGTDIVILSSEHLNEVFGINFENNSSFTQLDFQNLSPHLYVLYDEHPAILDCISQLIEYRLRSNYVYGEDFNLIFFQTAENNHFRCFMEYIWLLHNDYITQKDVEDILIFFKK